jgi:predicted nicotinamide N-methyase
MIIQVESTAANSVGAAKRSLEAIAISWGHEIAETPDEAAAAVRNAHSGGKAIDPVSVAMLVVSIPSAAPAAVDLSDRIHKRRRAKELIDRAQQLAAQDVTVCVMSPGRPIELSALTPDQLLDVPDDEDPAT